MQIQINSNVVFGQLGDKIKQLEIDLAVSQATVQALQDHINANAQPETTEEVDAEIIEPK